MRSETFQTPGFERRAAWYTRSETSKATPSRTELRVHLAGSGSDPVLNAEPHGTADPKNSTQHVEDAEPHGTPSSSIQQETPSRTARRIRRQTPSRTQNAEPHGMPSSGNELETPSRTAQRIQRKVRQHLPPTSSDTESPLKPY